MIDFDHTDKRLPLVLIAARCERAEELSQSDHDRIEDNYIAKSTACLDNFDDKQEKDLRAAGFDDLANKLTALSDANQAYNWSREHL